MSIFWSFSEVLLPIAVIIGIGYLIRRTYPIDLRSLNRVSIYVLSPSLVFVTLLRTEVGGGMAVRLALLMLLVILATIAVGFGVAVALRLSRPRRSGFLLTAAFMNSGNFGLSATRFAFGEVGFGYAVIGYLVQAIASQTLAVYLASAGNGSRRAALTQVFRLPLVYAVIAALLLRALGIQLDESDGSLALGLYRGIRLLADAALPLLLMLLGMQLTERPAAQATQPLLAAATLRLGVSIPLAFALGTALGLSGLPLHVGVLQAAMPTAVNMTILALEFDTWPEFVSSGVVVTTLGSLVTLTLLIAALR